MISKQSRLVKLMFSSSPKPNVDYTLPHPKWKKEELEKIVIDHKDPLTLGDKFAHFFIQSMRLGFDVMSGYRKVLPW